jgi:hypothetical protein
MASLRIDPLWWWREALPIKTLESRRMIALNRKLNVGVGAAIALAVAAGPSLASSVTMTLNELDAGQGVIYMFDGNGDGDFNGGAADGDLVGATMAGRFSWSVQSVQGANNPFSVGDTAYTFCTELTQHVSAGQTYTYDFATAGSLPSTGPMGASAAAAMGALFGAYYNIAVNGTNVQAAAFQLAVWEIAYEMADEEGLSALNVQNGEFRAIAGGSAKAQANAWLATLGSLLSSGELLGLTNLTSQDQLILVEGSSTPVPLPAPVLLAGVGLLGVAIGRRKLRRMVGT